VIVKEFRQKFGSIVADGQSEMKGQLFRIAHLGYFDIVDLFALVAELELILDANGVAVKLGAGVAAVQEFHARQTSQRKQPVTV
jgi:aspartate aminotransferase-like enzyme